MAIKKFVVISFATLASLSVVANNMVPVSAPTLVIKSNEIERPHDTPVAENRIVPAAPAQFPATQIATVPPVQIALASLVEPVSIPVSASVPLVVTPQEPIAVVESEPAIITETIASNVESPKLVAESRSFLVSEWLDVPREVIQRLSLEAPVPPLLRSLKSRNQQRNCGRLSQTRSREFQLPFLSGPFCPCRTSLSRLKLCLRHLPR